MHIIIDVSACCWSHSPHSRVFDERTQMAARLGSSTAKLWAFRENIEAFIKNSVCETSQSSRLFHPKKVV